VPLVNPSHVSEVPDVSRVVPPGVTCTVYFVTAEPSLVAAAQVRSIFLSPNVPTGVPGGFGLTSGRIAALGSESGPSPTTLVALTLNV